MKKTIFGLMAILAVCSFVLTSCYEKDPVKKNPSEYYVIGSVYDAETGNVISNATVTLDGKSVSSTFKVKLDAYVPSVTVSASAEGYVAVTRTVAIEKLNDYNQISYTSADVAMVKVGSDDPQLVVVGMPVAGGLDAETVKAHFGITAGDVTVGDKGLVEVHTHYAFIDNDLNVEANAQPLASTNAPYTVNDLSYSGYIWDYAGEYQDLIKRACNIGFQTVYVGTQYDDFAADATPFSAVLNKEGSLTLVGYCVCKDFTLWSVPVYMDGIEFDFMVLQAMSTHASPIVDSHNNHDNHGNHDNHHNNEDGHTSATAFGGGVVDAE